MCACRVEGELHAETIGFGRSDRLQGAVRTETNTRYALEVSDLEKRGSYTPRRVREQRLYRLAIVGGVSGLIGVGGLVLTVVGVIGAMVPILALVVTAICVFLARRVVAG